MCLNLLAIFLNCSCIKFKRDDIKIFLKKFKKFSQKYKFVTKKFRLVPKISKIFLFNFISKKYKTSLKFSKWTPKDTTLFFEKKFYFWEYFWIFGGKIVGQNFVFFWKNFVLFWGQFLIIQFFFEPLFFYFERLLPRGILSILTSLVKY